MDKITATLSAPQGITASLSGESWMRANIGLPTVISPPDYEGAYTVTPSGEIQSLATNGFILRDNITIYAIETMTDPVIRAKVAEGWQ